MDQKHLSRRDTVNFGAYYTRPRLVGLAYKMLSRHCGDLATYTLLDSSCGYGSFLAHPDAENASARVGADIDAEALAVARREAPDIRVVRRNSLLESTRADYAIASDARLIIVGNPPYNDTTALAGRAEKSGAAPHIAPRYKTRDLGISFLRSYADLSPDFVCVLHPLSYLIKKTNFAALGEFTRSYALADALTVSSGEFDGTAKGKTFFPIVLALYKRVTGGMKWEDISDFSFKTDCGKSFRVSDFTPLGEFVSFYPNAAKVPLEKTVARFFTMRDINALRRSRTFIDYDGPHTIRIIRKDLKYYRYAAVFKQYTRHIPYYFGNFPVFIDAPEFEKIRDNFMKAGAAPKAKPDAKIDEYFRRLLGEHFI